MAETEAAIKTGLDGYNAVIIALNEGKDNLTLCFASQSAYKSFRRIMRGNPMRIEKIGAREARVSFLNRN